MQIPDRTSDDALRWLFAAGAYFLSLIAFYIDIGQDMGPQYFMPLLIPVVLTLVLTQAGTGRLLFSRGNAPDIFAGLFWCSTFPLLYTWTYEKPWYMSLVSYDFAVGTAMLVLAASLAGLLAHGGRVRLAAAAATLLDFLFALAPLLQWIYYCLFWHCLSPASLMALYMTNWRESLDFMEAHIGLGYVALILAVLAFLTYLAYRVHRAAGRELLDKREAQSQQERDFCTGALLISLLAALGALVWHVPETSIAGLWRDVTGYVAEMQSYEACHGESLEDLTVDASAALPAKAPGTVILVIGESASRDYMHVYTPDFPYEDTPWLEARAADPSFLLFRNAYASWSQTVPVLQRALTEQSQYGNAEFHSSVSILDVAKKAGYETWWLSNQGRYGAFDSATTLVAKTADRSEWTDDSYNYSDKYDEALLPLLTQVPSEGSHFIVLHLMGSHIYYYNRYPSSFRKWETADGTGMATAAPSYANSILYTDDVLSRIFEYGKEHLNLVAMVYFSDHGENLDISHNPDVFSFDMVRIPMFIYLSPEYEAACPERAAALRAHRGRYFTNDMLYDTMCGLLEATPNRYDPRQDFSSESYAFTRGSLTTMLGERQLTEDPKGEPED